MRRAVQPGLHDVARGRNGAHPEEVLAGGPEAPAGPRVQALDALREALAVRRVVPEDAVRRHVLRVRLGGAPQPSNPDLRSHTASVASTVELSRMPAHI